MGNLLLKVYFNVRIAFSKFRSKCTLWLNFRKEAKEEEEGEGGGGGGRGGGGGGGGGGRGRGRGGGLRILGPMIA